MLLYHLCGISVSGIKIGTVRYTVIVCPGGAGHLHRLCLWAAHARCVHAHPLGPLLQRHRPSRHPHRRGSGPPHGGRCGGASQCPTRGSFASQSCRCCRSQGCPEAEQQSVLWLSLEVVLLSALSPRPLLSNRPLLLPNKPKEACSFSWWHGRACLRCAPLGCRGRSCHCDEGTSASLCAWRTA